jgi:hypothetical protein
MNPISRKLLDGEGDFSLLWATFDDPEHSACPAVFSLCQFIEERNWKAAETS